MSWLITIAGGLLSLAVWGLKVYLDQRTQAARDAERQAGADHYAVEQNNAETDRLNRAADAANRVRPGQAHDPNDRDGG